MSAAPIGRLALALGAALLLSRAAAAQSFLKIIDPANPVVTSGGPSSQYGGASWPDVDGDGDVDLYVNGVGLFRNDGGGAFTRMAGALPAQLGSLGNTWADVDNDGDLDVYVSGGEPDGSSLYLNQGDFVFTRVDDGAVGNATANRAWGCAFGDYDRDGWIDLVTAAANGFAGISVPNRLFHNDGAGVYSAVDSAAMSQSLGPYTIPSWSDYDLDGYPELWIGAGPVNGTVARDFLYRNRSGESSGWFERISTPPLGTDLQDGQQYNWIDIDNDGDLDVYLTNYSGPTSGMQNRLYRNDAGTFVQMPAGTGAIVNDAMLSLASVWQDYDNDGDLDCFVTNDGTSICRYYRNNGTGASFSAVTIAALSDAGPHYGAASGDYDDDGWMDLFLCGDTLRFALIRNTTSSVNGWLKVRLTGTASNRAAIGARVRVLATILGTPRWQVREISSQNSFNGMNSLEAHFGLRTAATADSVIVEWPSGNVSHLGPQPANTRVAIVEETVNDVPGPASPRVALAARVSPNPGSGRFDVRFSLPRSGAAAVEMIDVSGRRVAAVEIPAATAGAHSVAIGNDGMRAGVYFVRVRQADAVGALRVVVAH